MDSVVPSRIARHLPAPQEDDREAGRPVVEDTFQRRHVGPSLHSKGAHPPGHVDGLAPLGAGDRLRSAVVQQPVPRPSIAPAREQHTHLGVAPELRKKLRDDAERPRLVTEPGVGYRLLDPADPYPGDPAADRPG
jgi:hypothetical protein